MTTKVWNLKYALGNTGRIVGDASNPLSRKAALEAAGRVEKNGWRVWVEHHTTKKRIFESEVESAYREREESARSIRFAEENVPGYRGTSG